MKKIKPIGRKISGKEALKIATSIMDKAEMRRKEYSEEPKGCDLNVI